MGKETLLDAGAEAALLSTIEILLDFKKYPEKSYEPFLRKVLLCSERNPYKTVPDTVLAPYRRDVEDFVTARTNRDANPTEANNQFLEAAKLKVNASCEVLAVWVQKNCDNSAAIATSFGFKVAKRTRTAATKLAKPSDVSYAYGMPGEIIFKCKALGSRVQYVVECSNDGGLTWRMCGISTKSFRIIAGGLVRGKEYIFKIYGMNNAGNGYPYTSASIVAAV